MMYEEDKLEMRNVLLIFLTMEHPQSESPWICAWKTKSMWKVPLIEQLKGSNHKST